MAAKCRIRYTDTSIMVDYEPGCENFTYWLDRQIHKTRWKETGEGKRLGCTITPEEAEYIEKIANAQWGPGGCEIIGRPAPGAPAGKSKPESLNLF